MNKETRYKELVYYSFDDGDTLTKKELLELIEHLDKGRDLNIELHDFYFNINVMEEIEMTEEEKIEVDKTEIEHLKTQLKLEETQLRKSKENLQKKIQDLIERMKK